jgi:DNA ligase-1
VESQEEFELSGSVEGASLEDHLAHACNDSLMVAKDTEDLLMRLSKASGVRRKQDLLCAFVGNLKSRDLETSELARTLERTLYLAYDEFIRFGVSLEGHATPVEVFESIEDNMVSRSPTLTTLWDFVKPDGILEGLAEASLSGDGKRSALFQTLKNADCPATARIVFDIVGKDLRCGIAAKTVMKAYPGLLTEFEVMLAAPAKSEKMAIPSLVEVKYDGMRVIAQVVPNGAEELAVLFFTRSGRPVPAMTELFTSQVEARARVLLETHPELYSEGLCFDGEVTSGMDFNDAISDARRKSRSMEEGTFWVFDVIPISVMSGLSQSLVLVERRQHLNRAFKVGGLETPNVSLTKQITVHSFAEAELVYRNVRQIPITPGSTKTHEGVIIKNPQSLWQRKRSIDWMKLKACESVDAVVTGYFLGAGKYEEMLGGLVIDFNGVEVSVGSGFSDDQRRDFLAWAKSDQESSASAKKILGRLIEVEYQEVTNDGSLRHPVFVRLRSDKESVEF